MLILKTYQLLTNFYISLLDLSAGRLTSNRPQFCKESEHIKWSGMLLYNFFNSSFEYWIRIWKQVKFEFVLGNTVNRLGHFCWKSGTITVKLIGSYGKPSHNGLAMSRRDLRCLSSHISSWIIIILLGSMYCNKFWHLQFLGGFYFLLAFIYILLAFLNKTPGKKKWEVCNARVVYVLN